MGEVRKDPIALQGAVSEGTAAPYSKRWWALVVLSLGLLLTSLDAAIMTIAIPSLTHGLHASFSTVQWFLDSYLIVFASLQLGAGVMGDRLGRRGIFNLGMLIFAIGSFFSAESTSSGELIAMRAVMGLGAALVMPSTLSIVVQIFPQKEHSIAIAVWSGAAGIGIPLGPVLGGWLLSHFWWGSIFLINLPLIALGLIGSYALVPTSKDPSTKPFDWTGLALSLVGLAVLTYGIIEAPENGWLSLLTVGSIGVGLAILVGFIMFERSVKYPALNIKLLRNPNIIAAAATIALAMFAMYFVGFFFNQYLQFTLGYSPFQSGLRLLPTAIGLFAGSPLSIPLAKRFGIRSSVNLGLLMMGAGLALMTSFGDIRGSMLPLIVTGVVGFGIGLAATPATTSVMEAVPASEAGVASGINTITREIGGALGIAVLGSLLTYIYRQHVLGSSVIKSLPGTSQSYLSASIGSALAPTRRIPHNLLLPITHAAENSFLYAIHFTVVVAAASLIVGVVVSTRYLSKSRMQLNALPEE